MKKKLMTLTILSALTACGGGGVHRRWVQFPYCDGAMHIVNPGFRGGAPMKLSSERGVF